MNTKELRIGNMVQYTNDERVFVNLIGKTLEITAADILSIYNDNIQVEPILLAEEWLIKFGFKRVQEDKYGCHYENQECWVYLSHGGFDVEVITDDERFNLLRTYKYVHQLQNLYFAITGKELEAI